MTPSSSWMAATGLSQAKFNNVPSKFTWWWSLEILQRFFVRLQSFAAQLVKTQLIRHLHSNVQFTRCPVFVQGELFQVQHQVVWEGGQSSGSKETTCKN
jgi:hypothetical protein